MFRFVSTRSIWLVALFIPFTFTALTGATGTILAPSFAPAVNYAADRNPQSIVTGDFNGDGKLDLAVANSGVQSVSVFAGNRDGTFVPASTTALVDSPTALAVGDFNGDGKLDLVVVSKQSNTVRVLINNGSGGFTPATPFDSGGAAPVAVAVGHFFGPALDLAVVNQISGNVSILKNRGDGTFSTGTSLKVGSSPMSVAVGDFNHDGITDLAVVNSSDNTLRVLLGQGGGAFAPARIFGAGLAPGLVTVGDFNNDGVVDLAVGNSNGVSVMIGNGNGSFVGPTTVGPSPSSIVVADFNGDGNADIAVTDSASNTVRLLNGSGGGSFPAQNSFAVGSGPISAVVGDFNGDGKPDIAVANSSSANVSVLINTTSPPPPPPPTPTPTPTPSPSPTPPPGPPVLSRPTSYPVGTSSNPSWITTGDLNGDHKLDLVVADLGPGPSCPTCPLPMGNIDVLVGRGDGTFVTPAAIYGVGTEPTDVEIGDLNGDGKPDLVVANFGDNTVSVLMANVSGTFVTPAPAYAVGKTPAAIAIGDFNSDHKLDLAVVNFSDDNVSVLLGKGDGTFITPAATYSVGNGSHPSALAAGDFNNDGILDLAVVDSNANAVSLLIGKADGTFVTPAPTYAVGTDPNAVAISDFNGDGKLDLGVANTGDNSVSILLGKGDGTFITPAPSYAVGTSPFALATGDFNGDHKIDLVVADFGACPTCPPTSGDVSLLTGNGDGKFKTPSPARYSVSGAPVSIVAGDFNADGRVDVGVADANTAAEVLLNQSTAPTAAGSSISGRVVSSEGAPIPGVTVTVSGGETATTITDSAGNYTIVDLSPDGFYTVTPSRANYVFNPGNESLSLLGNKKDVIFTGSEGPTVSNPLDTSEFFVRQQYLDFLGREPDQDGLNFWSNQINACNGDSICLRTKRIDVSAAFFQSQEFEDTGSFIYRTYRAAYGRTPAYSEFTSDRSRVIGGVDLAVSKVAFADDFIRRQAFKNAYPESLTNEQFVNELFDAAGLRPFVEARNTAITAMNAGATRSSVLTGVIDDATFRQREFAPSFVLMQYFGYLQRDKDDAGFQFWLDVLNNRDANNYRGMVCSFLTSSEYQRRFSSIVSHTNQECG